MDGSLQRWNAQVAAMRATVERHRRESPSAEVAAQARLIALDTIGCALAGRRAPEVRALEASLAALEAGAFRFPDGQPLGLRAAAQLLAIGPTWDEACEGHPHAHGRPGIAVIAALLPLGLLRGATLGEFIAALVAGYEVGTRAGGWLRLVPGLHVDGNWPGIGVAAGVGRLLGLAPVHIGHALGIAACQLPYSQYLPVRTGSIARNTYLAHSAALGTDAALQAQAGFEAPEEALAYYAEHYCRADTEPMPPAAADLILGAYLKPFAAVRHVHYGAIAARALREELGGRTDAIRRIELCIYDEAIAYCGNRAPGAPLAAQFSLSFGVAAMLRFGVLDPSSYDARNFADAELRRLEGLVELVPDPGLSASRQRGARLTVTTDRAHGAVVDGAHPDLYLDAAKASAKFAVNARAAVPEAQSLAFCHALLSAAQSTPLRDVWAILVKPA